MNNTPSCWPADVTTGETGCNRFLLLTTGLGRLSGADVGVIAGARPYLEETFGLNAGRLSIVVATVLLGRQISTLLACFLTDLFWRKTLVASNGAVFVFSIPTISPAHCFGPLVHGRLHKEMRLSDQLMRQKLTKRLGWA
jgi:MFS transporter, SP family, solute carrier family 2 (myo-inositol transporter), member 13